MPRAQLATVTTTRRYRVSGGVPSSVASRTRWIVWPGRTLPPDIADAPLRSQAVLIHELTHVWQAQQGVNLLTGKLNAGDRIESYEYPLGMDCTWEGLNIEQQAMVVEHRFRLSRGQRVPADHAFYDRVCPIGRKGGG